MKSQDLLQGKNDSFFPTAIPSSLPQEFLVSLSICGSVNPGLGIASEVT